MSTLEGLYIRPVTIALTIPFYLNTHDRRLPLFRIVSQNFVRKLRSCPLCSCSLWSCSLSSPSDHSPVGLHPRPPCHRPRLDWPVLSLVRFASLLSDGFDGTSTLPLSGACCGVDTWNLLAGTPRLEEPASPVPGSVL